MRLHTRHIPEEHLNFDTPMGKRVKANGLCDVWNEPYLGALKAAGIRLVETRNVWWESEATPGAFNYDRLQRDMDRIEGSGFKVGVFSWFQHPPPGEDRLVRAKCLEHGAESSIPSLWDKGLLAAYDRSYADLAARFRDKIAFLYVGIYGDYGEVSYPTGIRHYKFSPPHNHQGYWCGDVLARRAFREFLVQKYGDVKRLNEAWGTDFPNLDADLMPPLPLKANHLTRRLDFMRWYTDSLLDFTGEVCRIVRRHFPDTPAGLPLGMVYEPLFKGQIKSRAAKIAAKHGMVARWTGLAHLREFALSNVCARRLSSPARFYGGQFGVEAALVLEKDNALNAIYEALANSAAVFHNDPANVLKADGLYERNAHALVTLPVHCRVAVYYPVEAELCEAVDMRPVYREYADLRQHCDYEIADSFMIHDGFLAGIDDLVLPDDCLVPKETARAIEAWVDRGGSVWHRTARGPRQLESGEPWKIGREVADWSRFGKPDGCFYTDHGDRFSRYDPRSGTIEFTTKDPATRLEFRFKDRASK